MSEAMDRDAALSVLLVEDDFALGEATAEALRLEGAMVVLYKDARSALAELPENFPGVVVSDVRLPGMDGIAFFARLQEIDPDLPVIFTTGHGDVTMAVDAMKGGAADFLTKPYSSGELVRSVRIAADKRRLILDNRSLREALGRQAERRLIGSSATTEKLRNMIAAVARSDIDTIVEGAAGTGKTFAARLIHDLSPRQDRPLVTIDAGILAHEDAELLIFGRDPSAGLSRTGLIERANGGTLLLDDLEAATGPMLARLLSVIETRSVLPLGAERPRKLNLRIIITRAVPADRMPQREETDAFYQRLGAVRIALPELVDRREDTAELFKFFVASHERELQNPAPPVGETQWHHLQSHDWPGNLRELSSFAREFTLGLNPGHPPGARKSPGRTLSAMVADFERAVLEDALQETRGNIDDLCDRFGTPKKTLYDKLARHGLKPRDFR